MSYVRVGRDHRGEVEERTHGSRLAVTLIYGGESTTRVGKLRSCPRPDDRSDDSGRAE